MNIATITVSIPPCTPVDIHTEFPGQLRSVDVYNWFCCRNRQNETFWCGHCDIITPFSRFWEIACFTWPVAIRISEYSHANRTACFIGIKTKSHLFSPFSRTKIWSDRHYRFHHPGVQSNFYMLPRELYFFLFLPSGSNGIKTTHKLYPWYRGSP